MKQNYCKSRSNQIQIPFVIFILLSLIYGLFYSGTYITDDEHILTSQTLSSSFDTSNNLNRVVGNSRVFENALVATGGDYVLGFSEPVQALISSGLAWASIIWGTGRIQTLLLLNIWITALTAVVIYLILKDLEYSLKVSFFVSLLFGLGTIVFPYTKSYFRDSLAMLFVVCTWYFHLELKRELRFGSRVKKFFLGFGLILSFTLGVLTKTIVLVAFPIVLISLFNLFYMPIRYKTIRRDRNLKYYDFLIAILCIFILAVIIIAGCDLFTKNSILNNLKEVIKRVLTNDHPDFLASFIGPFFSPGRSIFIYSPFLLFSFYPLFKRQYVAIGAWLFTFALVIAQGLFYDAEWAGYLHWDLRFFLPAIPLLIIASASTITELMKSKWGKSLILVISIISIFIQVLASLVPIRNFFTPLVNMVNQSWMKSTIWSFSYSQMAWAFQWILHPISPSIALLRDLRAGWIVAALVILILISLFLSIKKKLSISFYWLISFVSIFLVFSLPAFYKSDPAWSIGRKDFNQSLQWIIADHKKTDFVLIKSYGTPVWSYWMNWCPPEVKWKSLPYLFQQAPNNDQSRNSMYILDTQSVDILSNALQNYDRIWLVAPSELTGYFHNAEQNWLTLRSVNSSCDEFLSGEMSTTVCKFEIR